MERSNAVAVPPSASRTRRSFTVEEYHRMAEARILTEDDRVELMDGAILAMTPIGPRHAQIVNRLTQQLVLALSEVALVSVQNPIHLADDTEPQPDIALLRPDVDYGEAHPRPDDVLLLVEVADTSLDYDRGVKLPRYARAGIPEVWLVDVSGNVVEQYTEPRGAQYESQRTVARGHTLRAQTVPVVVEVEAILG
ncbi:MAG: Uma2 family endonuclease [Chloroflexota bacterium]|nr:Uma2 family endonuclease [Chloroflexota bacterium]